ncbi:MAG: hypothetical protein EP301_01285 [Gammaproteobacteria bacterium]|nr:MAG: hypothetical protein EP301_01285 [Gammaproteobacteria bacterium]
MQPDFFEPTESRGQPAAPPYRRLRSDYRWQAPALAALTGLATTPGRERQDPLEARMEVVLGIVVHGALERLAENALPEQPARFIRESLPLWRAMAMEHELTAEDVDRVVSATASQLEAVLSHDEGRWVLTPREDAASELALTGVLDGNIENLVIDRTFTDTDTGERWIVDFKTAIPHPDVSEDTFVSTEIARYRPQLARYGEVAAVLYDQPIRLALYFTALPKLVELTA